MVLKGVCYLFSHYLFRLSEGRVLLTNEEHFRHAGQEY